MPVGRDFFFQSGAGGGSSGQGGINYITNYGFEENTGGWSAYANAAAATPSTGTGGSPNSTLSRTTTTAEILRGAAAGKFSKGAANRQGEGFSYDFTLNVQDYDGSKPLYVSFDYMTSANYANNDYRVFVYDKDGATLLNVLSLTGDGSIAAAPDPSRFVGVFYSVNGNNDYRLIIHNTSTNASAVDFIIDNVSVSPQGVIPGAIISEWQSFTPTGSWTTNSPTYTAKWRRVGDVLEVDGSILINGAVDNVSLTVNLPTGFVIDTAKMAAQTTFGSIYGIATLRDEGTTSLEGVVGYNSTTSMLIYSLDDTAAGLARVTLNATTPFTWANTDKVVYRYAVPIVGWSASAALSTTEAMVLVATAKASGNPASATSGNPIIFPTKDWDPFSAYSTSTGLFTAPKTGKYKMYGSYISGAAGGIGLKVYVDAVDNGYIGFTDGNGDGNFTSAVSATKGQTISLRPDGTLDITSGYLIFEEIPDFSIFSVYGQTEFSESSSTATTSWPFTAAQWGDFTSISLTPGEWELVGGLVTNNNGAVTAGNIALGISSTSGNSTTGLDFANNRMIANNVGTTGVGYTLNIPRYRVVITSTTTYYLKGIYASTITNLQYLGYYFSARRIK